jgi:hypothetical protein
MVGEDGLGDTVVDIESHRSLRIVKKIPI